MSRQGLALAGTLAAWALLVYAGRRRKPLPVRCPGMTETPPYPLEPFAVFAPILSCDPDPKPGAVALRDWVVDNLGGQDWGISRQCSGTPTSRHNEGRAWDWAPPSNEAAWAFLRCLTDEDQDGNPAGWARRMGVRVLIYDRKIWSSGKPVWRPYGKTGNATIEHRDHVHVTLGWPGARAETSFYRMIRDTTEEPGEQAMAQTINLWGVPNAYEKTSPAFRLKVVAIARRLKLNPSALLAVMGFETAGTFSPRITSGGKDFADNPGGAVGLIQFTKAWAPVVVGVTTAELAQMDALRQLDFVEKWYAKAGGVKTIPDHYFAVFAPMCIGASLSQSVYVKGTKAYSQNAAMDADGDGVITCGDITNKFLTFVDLCQRGDPIPVELAPEAVELSSRVAAASALGLAAIVAAVAAGRWA